MAEEVKEDTNIENVENNENETVEVTEESAAGTKTIDPSLEGIQFFYESNKKVINYVGGGLLLVIGLFVAYKFYWLPEKEKEAANEIFWAQSFFERDSFNLALRGGVMVRSADGDKTMMGFEQVADEYGITATGNVAHYYAGICYLRTGQFEKAIEQLSQYSGDDEMVAPIAIGAIGDANMELNKIDEAVKFYLKAAEKRNNEFTTPMYLKKAATAYEAQNNFSEALNLYERIKKEYGKSGEARDIEKYIARVKAQGNL
jgi:tetratricopeptide (TPR) repeat protein